MAYFQICQKIHRYGILFK